MRASKKRFRCEFALLAGVWWLGSVPALSAQEGGWDPAKTHVFAVGILEWKNAELLSSFPKEDRRDAKLIAFFRDKGVPESQIVFLADEQATRAAIIKSLDTLLRKTQPDDLLVLYFAGHGVRVGGATYFTNYDITSDFAETGWSVASLFETLERDFKGSRVLLAADCCHSGALGVEAGKCSGRIAYAALASVHHNGLSTANWTFSDCLLKGLSGAKSLDQDSDGVVELDELARFTEVEMAFQERQMAAFEAIHGFAADFPLAVAVPGPSQPAVKRVEVLWEGHWYPASVLKTEGDRTRIHYAGFGEEWDEWVSKDRIRDLGSPMFDAQSQVEVQWQNAWWPAKVLEGRYGLHLIRYQGYQDDWDEWVGPERIRSKE